MENIGQILGVERLIAHFQPILSLNERVLFGVESLVRGVDADGKIVPPSVLFEKAKEHNITLELDKHARKIAIQDFEPLWRENKKLILFVNFESKLIDSFEPGNYLFSGELGRLGIPYENVVLEVKEDEIADTTKLKSFCDYYRELGFNIALDDFGVGQSSFDRISIVRPDVIKIDRSLITDISTNQIHSEIVGAIFKMCHNIGALPLAEGVESLNETVCCVRLGASLFQGFYFAKPSVTPIVDELKNKISEVNSAYIDVLKKLHSEEGKFHNMAKNVETEFCNIINSTEAIKNWIYSADELLVEHPNVEALYLVDSDNKQVGPTLIKSRTRSFYEPTKDGYDYSLKEYYVRAKSAIDGKHLTAPYLSLASGSLCRTYAIRIETIDNPYVLCIDFKV